MEDNKVIKERQTASVEKKKNRKAKWQNDYIEKKYDRINLTVPKHMKEKIQAAAKANNVSVNALIWRLLKAELDRLGIETGEK